jgi:acyl carrier protein
MTRTIGGIKNSVAANDRVREEVIQIVAEFSSLSAEKICENHNVFDDLGWDSLDVVECTMEIEEHFGITVPDEMGENIKTVGGIIDGVLKLLEKRDE